MQGKGTIRFFLIVMAVVCLYQFLLVIPTNRVERAADEHADAVAAKFSGTDQENTERRSARLAYLDSMSSETIFSIPLLKNFTYEELKRSQLNLGLDLKGGMSVIQRVDLRDFLRTLSNDSKDPTFLAALENATQAQANAQSDYITLFVQEFQRLSGGKSLASIFTRNKTLTANDGINLDSSDGEVARVIREKANETVELTFQRLKERIDEFGVTQPNVSLDAARDLILIELPGVDNPERARSLLEATAKLEFWDTYRVTDAGIISAFSAANDLLAKEAGTDMTPQVAYDTTWQYTYDDAGNVTDSTQQINERAVGPSLDAGPLLSLFNLNAINETGQISFPQAVMGTATKSQKDAVSALLERPDVKALFPKDIKFRWSAKASLDENRVSTGNFELYAIKSRRGSDKPPIEGDVVTDARATPDPQTGEMAVSLMMNNTGAKKWGEMTTVAAQNNNREVAIVLDDKVYSAPRVINAITGGNTQITGNFSTSEANDLASILQVGKLPAKPEIIQEQVVGPSLGAKNINRSITSLVVGFGILLAFMIFYYGTGGIVSIIALLLNLFFVFGALASLGTVLTLPGIAGIILTIGMAVDANVIIYERIREELREGKSLLASISDGFKHSYSAIIDANVTTILTAIVLAYFGIGPIKGFAVVLIIGVLSSLFTAVLVGRLIIDWWTQDKGKNLSFWTPPSKNAFANLNIDWLGKRRIAYVISGVLLVAGIASMLTRGFDLGVDFSGGYSYNVQFDQNLDISADQIRAALSQPFGSEPLVKEVDTDNTFAIVTDYLVKETDAAAAENVMAALHEGLSTLGVSASLDNFKSPSSTGTRVISSSKVGPTIADDIRESSIYAAVFALLLIFLYIFLRFNKWQYSAGAVAALFHDTLIVLGLFSLLWGFVPFPLEIDQAFIAAILTVIGYSINDTVVVFDRIREYMNAYTNKSKNEIINMAINSTVSRTVITSLTTLFVVLMLFVFGSGSIRGFAFALLIGIIVGTYSSIFVATPIMADLTPELKPKEQKKKSSFSKRAAAART